MYMSPTTAYASQHHDPRKNVISPVDESEIKPLANGLNRMPKTAYAVASHHTIRTSLASRWSGHSAIAHHCPPVHSLLGVKMATFRALNSLIVKLSLVDRSLIGSPRTGQLICLGEKQTTSGLCAALKTQLRMGLAPTMHVRIR